MSILSRLGIWVRQRDGNWQAKVRQGGDYTNSQFAEISGDKAVGETILKYVPQARLEPAKGFGLQTLAQLTTTRESWRADDKFGIALDITDFGHSVGEVELEEVVEWTEGTGPSTEERQKMASRLDAEIQLSMQKYAWAFPPGKPSGKLSAYFALRDAICRD